MGAAKKSVCWHNCVPIKLMHQFTTHNDNDDSAWCRRRQRRDKQVKSVYRGLVGRKRFDWQRKSHNFLAFKYKSFTHCHQFCTYLGSRKLFGANFLHFFLPNFKTNVDIVNSTCLPYLRTTSRSVLSLRKRSQTWKTLFYRYNKVTYSHLWPC